MPNLNFYNILIRKAIIYYLILLLLLLLRVKYFEDLCQKNMETTLPPECLFSALYIKQFNIKSLPVLGMKILEMKIEEKHGRLREGKSSGIERGRERPALAALQQHPEGQQVTEPLLTAQCLKGDSCL